MVIRSNFMLYAACRSCLLWLAAGLLVLSNVQAAEDFLPPEQVFHYSIRVDNERLIVTWKIAPGHYLYRKRMGFESATDGVKLAEPLWPQGENHRDEFFGDQEVYRGTVEFPVPVTFATPRPERLDLKLKLQGCADAGLCYPPQIWKANVEVPARSASPPKDLKSLFEKPTTASALGQRQFLPEDQAFQLSAQMTAPGQVQLSWSIAKGYYLYKSAISIQTQTPQVRLGALGLPKGEAKHDEYFGDTEVYYESLNTTVAVAGIAAVGQGVLDLTVGYQGCAEAGLCYPPITRNLKVAIADLATGQNSPSALPVAEQDRLAAALQGDNLAYALLLFFGAGLLLSLTPCVLPMIPILSGIIVGQGANVTRTRSFSLAFTYVQGMALTYAAAGAIFVLAFKQAPQAFFQQPWLIALMALLFVALAFAMFGAYTLQLPSALQTRLSSASDRQKSGTYLGTFVMGALSALVVTACVAPALIAALSVISQTRQIFRGAAALYATGLGMGVPLLIVGASAGTLLPKAGPWMETVKQLFGVLFLGVAIYLLQPLVPGAVVLLLWSALAIVSGFWIFSLKARDGAPAAAPLRATGLLAIIYGVLLLIGSASGGKDPLQPLERFGSRDANGTPAARQTLGFQRVKSVEELEGALAAATAAGKPVMFDFYADWCVSCKEMEKYTFPESAVRAALSSAVLLQADVTANDAQDRELLKRFDILGPPSIIFFGSDGHERAGSRIVGYMKAAQFESHVQQAFALH